MPPLLAGLSHSEGAYAPFFDAFTFDYTAVVPDVTSTITILPFTENQSVNVTVNGGDPSQPVNLNSTVTDISILLGANVRVKPNTVCLFQNRPTIKSCK